MGFPRGIKAFTLEEDLGKFPSLHPQSFYVASPFYKLYPFSAGDETPAVMIDPFSASF